MFLTATEVNPQDADLFVRFAFRRRHKLDGPLVFFHFDTRRPRTQKQTTFTNSSLVQEFTLLQSSASQTVLGVLYHISSDFDRAIEAFR